MRWSSVWIKFRAVFKFEIGRCVVFSQIISNSPNRKKKKREREIKSIFIR